MRPRFLLILLFLLAPTALHAQGGGPLGETEPIKALEFGRVPQVQAIRSIRQLWTVIEKSNLSVFIINYGTETQTVLREQLISQNIKLGYWYPTPRVTFVRGGPAPEPRTVIWLTPPGGKLPKP